MGSEEAQPQPMTDSITAQHRQAQTSDGAANLPVASTRPVRTETDATAQTSDGAARLPVDPDICSMLIQDKRSENTKRAYAYDLSQFFRFCYDCDPSPERVCGFLRLTSSEMTRSILSYKAWLIAQQRTEATINRRLSAIMSLVAFARRLGITEANPADRIDTEKVKPYRDTRGIGIEEARKLLAVPGRGTLKGARNYLLLLLLLENALRRAELTYLTCEDVEAGGEALWIRGKGRGTQKERVTLSTEATAALRDYVQLRSLATETTGPLFISLSPAWFGRPLTPDGVYKIVQELAVEAELGSRLSPHRLRHTSITLALDASQGDIRKVRRLSRHARLETLQIYDDNRTDMQGEMTAQLSDLLKSRHAL